MKRKQDPAKDLEEGITDLAKQLSKALVGVGFVLTAQGAMGAMVQGNPERARVSLARLNADQRAKVAAAARELAAMAGEPV